MGKAKAFLPHEQMMETFRKANRIQREELSLNSLVLDHKLQAREKSIDIDNVMSLHSVVKDGLTLAPITVFRINGRNNVGNGFHRTEVHRREGLQSILADVILDATWQEAVEFATCCNMANHAMTPTKEDKKKATFMLLDNGWLSKSNESLASHCGVSATTAMRWTNEYCTKKGVEAPVDRLDKNGNLRSSKMSPGRVRDLRRPPGQGKGYRVHVNGKRCNANSAEKAANIAEEYAELMRRRREAIGRTLSHNLLSNMIFFRTGGGSVIRSLRGGATRSFAVTGITEDGVSFVKTLDSIISAIGRVLVLAENFGVSKKVILVAEPIKSHDQIIEIAGRMGINFMTLEKFIEIVKTSEIQCEDIS
jgi:hypothetical protein